MTNQHPLTDEMCERIAPMCRYSGDVGDFVFRHGDMRAAYDKGAADKLEQVIEQITYETRCTPDPGELVFNSDDVRAAADWQLEQCVKEVNQVLHLLELAGRINEADRTGLVNIFKKAMRPQQQQEDN